MSRNAVIIWSVIWISCAVASIGTRNVDVMGYPAVGMLLWWFTK